MRLGQSGFSPVSLFAPVQANPRVRAICGQNSAHCFLHSKNLAKNVENRPNTHHPSNLPKRPASCQEVANTLPEVASRLPQPCQMLAKGLPELATNLPKSGI
jgi:hypothetical protein